MARGSNTLPWAAIQGSFFSFDLQSNLHPWGCYMVAMLPRSILLLRTPLTWIGALKGHFGGLHVTTPTYNVHTVYNVQCTGCTASRAPLDFSCPGLCSLEDKYLFLTPPCVLTPGVCKEALMCMMLQQDTKKRGWAVSD